MQATVQRHTSTPPAARWALLLALAAPWLGLVATIHRARVDAPSIAPVAAIAPVAVVAPGEISPPSRPETTSPLAVPPPASPGISPARRMTLPAQLPAIAGVESLGSGTYGVPHAALQQHLENPAALLASTHAQPWMQDGRMMGIRLEGDAARWPLAAIGLAPGDVIRAVNGHVLDSPDRVLEAYWRFQRSDRISLSVLRDGGEVDLEYRLQ